MKTVKFVAAFCALSFYLSVFAVDSATAVSDFKDRKASSKSVKTEKIAEGWSGFGQNPWVISPCDGREIFGYGDCFVWQGAPDIVDDTVFQLGNDSPKTKIAVKKSSEIKSNFVGINTSRMPRSRDSDYYYAAPAHLLDGNVQTCWASAVRQRSDVSPAWFRIDFPVEREIEKVVFKKRPVLVPRKLKNGEEVGRGMASKLRIEASADGYEWKKIFDGDVPDSKTKDVFEFLFPRTKAKMLRVTALDTPPVGGGGHCFSIAEFEAFDKSGENVAKISRGTGVVASSTDCYMRPSYEFHNALWKIHGNLGAKFARIGYHDDPINWHEVERERGIYRVDAAADAAINGLVNDGIEIIMCLNFGNRLYTGQKGVRDGKAVEAERPKPYLPEWNSDVPLPPTTQEALAAWDKYIEFMARKYADKVSYFEIWNEWNAASYWGDKVDVKHFLEVSKRAIKILRQYAPKAKIMMGSITGFPYGCSAWTESDWNDARIAAMKELAPLVDAMGVHPYYQPDVKRIERFEKDFPVFVKWLRSAGFKGEVMISEWNFSTSYPSMPDEEKKLLWCNGPNYTEVQKAKFVSQRYISDAGNGVKSFFCEMYNPFYVGLDLSLLRRTGDGSDALQPQAAFYAVRNIASITDGYEPFAFKTDVAASSDISNLRAKTFKTPNGYAAALWLGIDASDASPRRAVNLSVGIPFKKARAIDVLNGTIQNLSSENGVVKNLMLNDTPLIVEFFN